MSAEKAVMQEEERLTAEVREALAPCQEAARKLALLDTATKNDILAAMADQLVRDRQEILQANAEDVAAAERARLAPALCDRLTLTDARFAAMAQGVRELIALNDPVGVRLEEFSRPNGLVISKVSVPIGVIAIIYEARPNVTADAAALCIKTSNAVVLKGGSEARRTNEAITRALLRGGEAAGLPPHSIVLLTQTDRRAVRALVQSEGLIDLVIPRGGEGLIRAVAETARVPVLKHYKGVCHVYVHAAADEAMALSIIENAKCQRPGVCNAAETLLIDAAIAPSFLPKAAAQLRSAGVELRGDEATQALVPESRPADESDWETEYLDLVLAVRVVPDIDAAIAHINRYGSKHTDAIVSSSPEAQERFTAGVDTGVVMVNASTRFNDGGEFGFGAEMGISTDKFHARGPVGPRELTTYKYVVRGSGQLRG